MTLRRRLNKLEDDMRPGYCPLAFVVIGMDGRVMPGGPFAGMPAEQLQALREKHSCEVCRRHERLGLLRGVDYR